jgi:hypothetical protein
VYLDVNGLITQQNGDGGDKLQREGFWFTGVCFNPSYPSVPGLAPYATALQILTDANGNLERDEIKYTAILDPNDVSRDQLVPNVIACGLFGYEDKIKRIFSNVVKNFSRYPNNDLAFITDYTRIARALGMWYLYPILFILDIWLLMSITFLVIRSYFDSNNTYVSDDLNSIADLAQTKQRYPSPFSFMARKIFKWFRKGGPMYGMNVYFNPATGANQEFVSLWTPIVERF